MFFGMLVLLWPVVVGSAIWLAAFLWAAKPMWGGGRKWKITAWALVVVGVAPMAGTMYWAAFLTTHWPY